MSRVPLDTLRGLVVAALTGVGAVPEAASKVADGLVGSDAAGVSTHGVAQLPRYLEAVRSGELDPLAVPVVTWPATGLCRVEGRWSFGHVAADIATRHAIDLAQQLGVGAVSLVEAHHIGRLGGFVEIAAEAGVVLLIFGGGQGFESPAAVAHGGRRAVLHTNPIAIGAPGPDAPFVVDIATTVMSGLKVREAAERQELLPPGAIVDEDGEATRDPGALLRGGSHLPFGGHKGYGLMVAAEVLGRIVAGADDMASTTRGGPSLRHAGYLFLSIRADAFGDRSLYDQRTDALFAAIRGSGPAAGVAQVMVPGDPEAQARRHAETDGIEVSAAVLEALSAAAGESPTASVKAGAAAERGPSPGGTLRG